MRKRLLNFRRSDDPGTARKSRKSASGAEFVAPDGGLPIDMTEDGSPTPAVGPQGHVVATGSVFDSVLSKELLAPSVSEAEPPPPPGTQVTIAAERPVAATSQTFDGVPGAELSVDQLFDSPPVGAPAPLVAPVSMTASTPAEIPAAPPFPELGFWDRYDEATASAELFAVPPAAITAIVGAIHVAAPVVKRCRDSHWVSECDVHVLTSRPELIEDPTWKLLKRPSDVVALLDDGLSDFPLIVVDIARELPTWIRPLTSRLRAGGVGLVRYVLDDNPSDEDLATWHGELGRPSVLDLVAAVPPARVLDLLDRGEPVASVGGMPITADLLMALRLSV